MINGVDINLCRNNGISFFYVLFENGFFNIVKYLLLYKDVKVDLCDEGGVSFFYYVCLNGYENIV